MVLLLLISSLIKPETYILQYVSSFSLVFHTASNIENITKSFIFSELGLGILYRIPPILVISFLANFSPIAILLLGYKNLAKSRNL